MIVKDKAESLLTIDNFNIDNKIYCTKSNQ